MWAGQLFRGVFHFHIISAADSRISWSHSVFSGVSSVCNRHAEGPGGCGRGVFVNEEVDGVGEESL